MKARRPKPLAKPVAHQTKPKPVAMLCIRSEVIALQADRAGADALPFEGVAYNGGIMFPTLSLDGESERCAVVVDLDTLTIVSPDRPVLDDHDDTNDGLIGRTTKFAVDKSDYTLPVEGVLYPQKSRTKRLLDASRGGHKWQLSVGLDQFDVERIAAGRTVRVNNRTFTGPLIVARRAYLTDVSFVAVGGDDTTWATIAARRLAQHKTRLEAGQTPEGSEMSFEEWMAANFPSMDLANVTDAEKALFVDQFEDANEVEGDRAEGEGDEEEETETDDVEEKPAVKAKAKRQRKAGTDGASTDQMVEQAVARALKASRADDRRCAAIDALANGNTVLASRAKAEGWPVDKFELTILRAGRSSHSGASTKADDDEGEVMEAALLLNSGIDQKDIGKWFPEAVMNKATAKRYRGFSMVECGDQLMRRAGVRHEGSRNQKSHMLAVRSACAKLEAAGFTSLTLSNILENAADKVLINAYQAVETVWQKIGAIRSLNDFKIHSQYALDPLNTFQKVGPEGDFAQLQMSDRKYSLSADSFGVRIKVDYQTWRNDDMSAINDRLAMIGTLGASTIEQVFFALLMAGIGSASLFHASNNNYDATASSVFGVAGLKFAETLWAKQVRQNNTPLGISPQTLLVGTALKTDAGNVFTSAKLNEVFDSTNNTRKGPVGSDNPFVQKYEPTVAPYIDNTLLKDNAGAAIAHQNAATWMMFARQGNNAAMHVGFLDGNQSPKVEVINNQSELVGFEMLAALHFGVGYGDPKLAAGFNPNAA